MHWMHLPLDHYRAHFSFSLLALTIASALPAYGGKFNPKFLENVQGIDQHVDLSVYDSPVGQQIPGKYRVFVFVNEEKMASRTLDFSTASEAQR
ncbi:fimbrial assembly protein, partial [Escherichia coli]|nr:fimbrial assembly protein [Escherichia coli]